MATVSSDIALQQIQDVTNRLQAPVSNLTTLLSLLSSPLACLGLLPPPYSRYNTEPLPDGSVNVPKHIPPLQRAVLKHIAPTWGALLAEESATLVLEQYFCPDSFSFASPAAGEVALIAYSTILSQPLTEWAIRMLGRLSTEYPVDRLHSASFAQKGREKLSRQILGWEDCVRNVVMVPGKVANINAAKSDAPPLLEHGTYFNRLSIRSECLIFSLSTRSLGDSVQSVTYLMAKLVNLGVFPAAPPVTRSQPSFFQATLPVIRARLENKDSLAYSGFWSSLIQGLPSSITLQSILTSLFASLTHIDRVADNTPLQRALVKREARLLHGMVGIIAPEKQELWESASAVILQREWDICHARMFVCWASGGSFGGRVDEQALGAFLNSIMDMWSSPDYIKHSLFSRHRYVTSILLIAISYFPPASKQLHSLAFSATFISGVGIYLAHLDTSVRRCGMLAAEVVAQFAGKKLDFGDWDGDDSGKPWAREIRQLIKQRDVDSDMVALEVASSTATEVGDISTSVVSENISIDLPSMTTGYDSDDSLTGYASSLSSRSASPTPSELDEIEKDPTLNVGVKKVPRPVYLTQLGEILRSTGGARASDDPHEADKIEMGLNCAEELIRKKRGYGTELDENAVNLVYGLLGLQDNYDLDNFEIKRQSAMNALVVCSPRKAAPALIEEFFKNQYSTSQRYVALNALGLGAREMASLSLPPSTVALGRVSFPGKTLPLPLHKKYLAAEKGNAGVIPSILDSISHQAIERGKEGSSNKMPELVRERRLRVQKPHGIVELSEHSETSTTDIPSPITTTFTEVAAEFFIAPFINRFWLFLRDEQTREERTAHRNGRQRYHGAGTGLILNPVVLAHFLKTMAILVHASQNAPEWLAVIAPEGLELAVTLGTRPVSHTETDDKGDDAIPGDWGPRGKEASVLTSALELALVVLDGCLILDGGRIMGLEHTALLLGTGEWAGAVFSQLEKGLRVEGGGGSHEIKLRRAVAGVLLKVDDLVSRWRRSMLDTR